jgi:hypothetical protein
LVRSGMSSFCSIVFCFHKLGEGAGYGIPAKPFVWHFIIPGRRWAQ